MVLNKVALFESAAGPRSQPYSGGSGVILKSGRCTQAAGSMSSAWEISFGLGFGRAAWACAEPTAMNESRRPRDVARMAVVARAGWRWAAVEGTAEVIGPDDPHPAVDADALRLLLREVFTSAGGTHDDWDTYDRTLADERSAAVLVTSARTYPRT